MIDFIKFKILNPDINYLLNIENLDFDTIVNNKTGQIKKYVGYDKNIKLELYEPTHKNPNGILLISGSLHKYFNNGKHNYNQFTKINFLQVVKELTNKYKIKPKESTILSLEMGLNIYPDIPTKEILNSCLMHRKTPFKNIFTNNEGNYIQVKKQRYIIKIYDKKKHYSKYNIPNEIMRFELKYLKMIELNKQGIYTLQDLMQYDFNNFKNKLIKVWNEILFYEPDIWDNTNFEYKYNNVNFWKRLKNDNYKYHLKKMKRQRKNGIQNQIKQLIKETKI